MTLGTSSIGFNEVVRLNLRNPVADQLRRRKLFARRSREEGDPNALKKIIENNASLRVDFGWAFESEHFYKQVINDCIREVLPKYMDQAGLMTADGTCSWIGFVPHNAYDREVYKDMPVYSLIQFNNELIGFQIEVVEFISNHHLFRQHAFMRDDQYRFSKFKSIRKDRLAMTEAYHYYMTALHEVSLIPAISRDIIEEQIGCHFLYQPDLFFELLEFSILKGEIYG
jgi:hypothetical protein